MLIPDKIRAIGAALVVGTLAAAGCLKTGDPPGPRAAVTPTVKVSEVHPQWKSLRRVVEQPGTVVAYEETQLYARVPGYVRRLNPTMDIGYRVTGPKYDPSGTLTEPGEVLAELAVPELEQEVQQKQAAVRQAQAEVEQSEKALVAAGATIAVADAGVLEAQALSDRWESEAKRMAGLSKTGVVDLQSRDEIQTQFRAAAARLTSARASVDKAKADRDKAEADVRAVKARVDVATFDARRAADLVAYAQIRAPYDGVITARKASTGDLVQPNGGKGDWLFNVARLDPVRVVVAVPETDAELIHTHGEGDKTEVKLTIPSQPGSDVTRPVTRTSWSLQAGARTLRAEIDLPNADHRLRPGLYVNARFVIDLPPAWVLPTAAVVPQADGPACFLLADGKAVRVPVQLGRSDGQFVAVIKCRRPGATDWGNLTADDAIAARAAVLSDGQGVQVEATGK